MKRNEGLRFLWLMAVVLLAGCLPLSRETTVDPAPPLPTLVLQPATAVATPATVSPTAVADVGETAVPPTHTPTVVADAGETAVPLPPALTTQGATNVRLGPGTTYGVRFVLPAQTTRPLLGRTLDSTWWFVPGADGRAVNGGWVSGAVVALQGDTSGVPFMAPPTLTPTPPPPAEPALPVLGNAGPPPGGSSCVIAHPGPSDGGPTLLRQVPEPSAPAVAELGFNRWALIVALQNGWYQVQDAAGLSGWVHELEVAFAGECAPPGGDPNLPLVAHEGAPPGDRCLASRRGQFPRPLLYAAPGRHFPLVAQLQNWAEILRSEAGWHEIAIGNGQTGWLNAEDVELIGSCGAPAPQRIVFEPGAISAIVDGALQPPRRDVYVFRALAGQRMILEIQSTDGRANFMLSGMSDRQPYKRLEDELRLWSGQLPLTQDYLLTVAAPADAPPTEYSLELIIEPLP